MYWLQPVACIWQSTVHNRRQRIGQVAVTNGAPQRLCHIIGAKIGVAVIIHMKWFSGARFRRKARISRRGLGLRQMDGLQDCFRSAKQSQ